MVAPTNPPPEKPGTDIVPWVGYVTQREADFRFAEIVRFYDTILAEKDRAIQIALDAANDARTTALATQEKRLDEMNHFRHDLEESASRNITRTEAELASKTALDKVDALRETFDQRFTDLLGRLETTKDEAGRQTQAIMLALANRVTVDSFGDYQERQDDQALSGRRALSAAVLAVGLGVASVVTSILIAVLQGHR